MRRLAPVLVCAMTSLLAVAPQERAQAAGSDVVVTVAGPAKKPLEGVRVALGVKSFPGGKFEFHDHDAKTDAKGRATFADVVPAAGRYGIYATVAEKGWTLVSTYAWSGKGGPASPIAISVEPAAPLRLRFVDDAGKAMGGVAVGPAMRCDAAGARHTLRGALPAASGVESGADGIAELACFLPGEWVGVAVRFPGRDLETRTVLVPSQKDAVVEVSSQAPTTPDREVLAGGDASRRLFVTGPKAGDVEPPAGYGLVLVLPGGDGGDGFRPWVRERYDEWVDAGWVWVQLVAPKWSEAQPVVWPTAATRQPGMKFTTEEFADSAVAEVEKTVKVDRRRVVALSWSSSGPACWRMLTTKSSAVTAHLISMSVFHPKELEPLGNGKQRPLFLLHSPDDKTCPIAMAEQGRDAAKKAGLKVEWATYEGGHGWAGESEDEARRGLHWLAEALR